ncbi:MAG: hypothetical protein ACC642_02670 [Pseudomonadales bacterium]
MRQRFRAWLNRADPLEETWSGIGRVWRHSAWILIVLVGLILAVQSATGIYGWLGTAAILGLLLAACLGVWLALILLSWLPSGVRGGLLLLVVPLVPVALFAPLMLAALYVMLALTLALTTAGFLRYRRGLKTSGSVMLTVGGLSLLLSLFAFAITGWDTEAPSGWSPIKSERLRLQSPVEPGAYNVVEMSYTDPATTAIGSSMPLRPTGSPTRSMARNCSKAGMVLPVGPAQAIGDSTPPLCRYRVESGCRRVMVRFHWC